MTYQPSPENSYRPGKKRRKWPWIVGVVVLVGGVGLFTLVLGGTAKVASALDDDKSGRSAVVGRMNAAATDGKFQFTVTALKCGAPSIGGNGSSEKAQGQFCILDVTVTNVGPDAELFTDSSQKGYDENDTEYSVASGGGVYENKDYSAFLDQIDPGTTVKGKLAFDVPTGTKLSYVVLHASLSTPGVKIPLA